METTGTISESAALCEIAGISIAIREMLEAGGFDITYESLVKALARIEDLVCAAKPHLDQRGRA